MYLPCLHWFLFVCFFLSLLVLFLPGRFVCFGLLCFVLLSFLLFVLFRIVFCLFVFCWFFFFFFGFCFFLCVFWVCFCFFFWPNTLSLIVILCLIF